MWERWLWIDSVFLFLVHYHLLQYSVFIIITVAPSSNPIYSVITFFLINCIGNFFPISVNGYPKSLFLFSFWLRIVFYHLSKCKSILIVSFIFVISIWPLSQFNNTSKNHYTKGKNPIYHLSKCKVIFILSITFPQLVKTSNIMISEKMTKEVWRNSIKNKNKIFIYLWRKNNIK